MNVVQSMEVNSDLGHVAGFRKGMTQPTCDWDCMTEIMCRPEVSCG